MNTVDDFHKISYKMHESHFKLIDNHLDEFQKSWFKTDTVGYWRYFRSFVPFIPLIKESPLNSWLTIGDGRFGRDSIELKNICADLKVLPTDICPDLLDYSKNQGWIEDFKIENAELLSFEKDSFDYVLCRESYHHFPRPMIALHEMLRIAKKAVVLVEPNDHYYLPPVLKFSRRFKNFIKRLLKRTVYHPDHWSYEESGNYIYSLSPRDLEKVALGLNFPLIAFRYYNDYYEEGIEFEKANKKSVLFKKIKRKLSIANIKSRLGMSHYSSIIGIIFKETPNNNTIEELRKNQFKIVELCRNPYIK